MESLFKPRKSRFLKQLTIAYSSSVPVISSASPFSSAMISRLVETMEKPELYFGGFALNGAEGLKINSMCTVFAETEATSLMARGSRPEDIAFALHLSVVKRSISMLRRISTSGPIVFSGGVARNPCISELVRREIPGSVLIPDDPDMIGALGAALYGIRRQHPEDQSSEA
jgi:(R)-2-hydroxyacyl-CoA dehydratese activating ATPase